MTWFCATLLGLKTHCRHTVIYNWETYAQYIWLGLIVSYYMCYTGIIPLVILVVDTVRGLSVSSLYLLVDSVSFYPIASPLQTTTSSQFCERWRSRLGWVKLVFPWVFQINRGVLVILTLLLGYLISTNLLYALYWQFLCVK